MAITTNTKQFSYNDPANKYGQGEMPSSIDKGSNGRQINTSWWHKKTLIELAKEQHFGQLSDTIHMPKHFGKKIVMYHYLPLLDDRNVNDMGIDADGVAIANGNLYGSSRDFDTVNAKIPRPGANGLNGEWGGRFNRVGFSRKTIEGTFEKIQFFTEFTKDSFDYDSDSELYGSIVRELLISAAKIQEDLTAINLLNGAGIVKYCGAATQNSEMTGEGQFISEVTYADLQNLSLDLDRHDTPRKFKIINGSRLQDTVTIEACRPLFCGPEMVPTLTRMVDHFGNPAFVSLEHYAYSTGKTGMSLNGEIGKVAGFRIIQNNEMLTFRGKGAAATGANEGYSETGGKYDIFPMLCVGDGSFSHIGFQTTGGNEKFKIKYVMPGSEISYGHHDPYGETGFISLKTHMGILVFRPERIALLKTLARA